MLLSFFRHIIDLRPTHLAGAEFQSSCGALVRVLGASLVCTGYSYQSLVFFVLIEYERGCKNILLSLAGTRKRRPRFAPKGPASDWTTPALLLPAIYHGQCPAATAPFVRTSARLFRLSAADAENSTY